MLIGSYTTDNIDAGAAAYVAYIAADMRTNGEGRGCYPNTGTAQAALAHIQNYIKNSGMAEAFNPFTFTSDTPNFNEGDLTLNYYGIESVIKKAEEYEAQVLTGADGLSPKKGRFLIFMPAGGEAQARIIFLGDDPDPEPDEPTPTPADTPIITIEKYDASTGGQLDGVILKATVDGAYTQTGVGNNFLIDFSALIDGGTGVKAELSNPYMNCAGKLIDNAKYQTGLTLTQGNLPNYVESIIYETLSNKITASPTYQEWQRVVAECTAGCSNGHPHCKGGCYWVPRTPIVNTKGVIIGYTGGYWANVQTHKHDKCPDYQAAMEAALQAAKDFAHEYRIKTETVKDWLYDYKYDPTGKGYIFGTEKDQIPDGELKPVEFIYSAWTFYENCKDNPIKRKNLLQVYTGDLQVDITEVQTLPGYLLWQNENTKTVKIQYGYPEQIADNDGARVKNGLDYNNSKMTYNPTTYLSGTNDEVEVEHEGTRGDPSDGTYDATKIKCYNEPADVVVFELNKWGELTSTKKVLDATFQIDLKATENYWGGSSRTKTASYTLTTQGGKLEITSGDYWERLGIDVIHRWKGTIEVTITEKATDEHYILWDHPKTFKITYSWAGGPPSIVEVSDEKEGPGEDAIIETVEGIKVKVDAYNTPKTTPPIIIQKNDLSGSGLKGATFDAVITRLDTGAKMELPGLATNDAGQIIIYAEDLDKFAAGSKIDVINRWTGTLRITLTETKAPDGYKLIEEPIVVDINFDKGVIKSLSCSNKLVTAKPYNTSYTDNAGTNGIAPAGTITITNELNNKLRIRKVDGDTIHQDYLGNEARFSVTVTLSPDGSFKGSSKTITETVDSKGYIDLTKVIEDMNVNLGEYSGEINVKMRELRAPNGYLDIDGTIEVTLIYRNGYLTRVTYPNKDYLSKAVIDVGESENRTEVTIAIKNTQNEIQPIYISKVDSQTGKTLYNVDFKVTISTSEITNSTKGVVYNTSDDGLIAIPKEALEEIGLTGIDEEEVYILLEELGTVSGYKHLNEKVYIKVEYEDGDIRRASVIKGESVADTTITKVNGKRILKISVDNERVLPDLIISKESLSNGNAQVIESAVFNVNISAAGKTINKRETVGKDGKIIFTGQELEALGINGTYTGDITVDITEESVENAVIIPEKVQAVISVENGRYVSSKVSNVSHVSVVSNTAGSYITIKVLNDIVKEDSIISGIVWEEAATTKAEGTLRDGKYTTSSDSEYSDKLFEGIEVTLYQKAGSGLTLVTELTGGTNPTLTNSEGYYEFQVPMKSDNYVVKFTYNGQTYMASPSEYYNYDSQFEDWRISSKGSEFNGSTNILSTRNYVNTLLQEIGSYPANYPMRTALFSSNDIPDVNNLRTAYASGYNVAYRYDELEDVYGHIKDEMNKYLKEIKIMSNEKSGYMEVYTRVINNYYKNNGALIDNEIYNKLQYIYDSRVSAYAGHYTRKDGVDELGTVETYNANSKDLNAYQRFVNLGIYRRDKTDLTLKKDLYKSTVSINRYDETYNYNTGKTTYTQYVYEEDYNYSKDANSNGIAWYQDDEVELYLKYKITVTNTTNTPTKLTEIADYFDSRFGYSDEYTTSSGAKLKGVEVFKNGDYKNPLSGVEVTEGGKYIPASRIGLEGTKDYAQLFVTFKDGQEPSLVKDGDKVEIFVTIKLGKNGENGSYKINNNNDNNKDWASDILYKAINNPQDLKKTMEIRNYAEINGYKTYVDENCSVVAGYLDADSKPGTFIVKDYENVRKEYLDAYENRKENPEKFASLLEKVEEIRQDDTWSVQLNIKNNLTDENNAYYHRTMNGNVWEAINDQVKTSTDLYNDTLLQYIASNGLKGIVVELVELEPEVSADGLKPGTLYPNGKETVRARTVTGGSGEYTFTGYIAGDYSVRFVYGEDSRDGYTDSQNNMMKDTSINGGKEGRGINGQYYQSTKANPNTDKVEYWYAKYAIGDNGEPVYEASSNEGVVGNNNTERYSDAYDEVTSRINQIEAKTAGANANAPHGAADNSWSWDYEWDGVDNVQTRRHLDTIDAYTSTMKVEIEYTKKNITGNKENSFYRYQIDGVDFGVTPRAVADLNIDKYVSNIKLYLQDSTTLQLDVDFNEDGSVKQYNNDAIYQNIVVPTPDGNNAYRDGLIEVLMDTQLLNGTTLEVTYTITTSNDGQYNTITYFYDTDNITKDNMPIALAYYNGHNESLETIVYYEGDRSANGITKPVVKHETAEEKFEVKNTVRDVNIEVKTRATNIIDYVDPALNFTQVNKKGEAVNRDWELTTLDRFNSTRENSQYRDIMSKYNTIIRAKGGDTYENYLAYLAAVARGEDQNVINQPDYSPLYRQLLPGEKAQTTLVLSKVLQTTSTGTNEYEYSNLIELTKLENYAGKIIDLESYDITGENGPETSTIGNEEPKTIGTSKSETIVIHEATGLSASEEYKSNLVIVLTSLVILAGGIFLIKKFVLKPKAE